MRKLSDRSRDSRRESTGMDRSELKETASVAKPRNVLEAFERRFLYKIRFDKPSEQSRARIWQIMLPNLSEKEACILASQFDMSGGEIENVARKQTVSSILSGKETIDIEEILHTCRQERISDSNRTRIGF